MKKFKHIYIFIIFILLNTGCLKETYRTDNRNKMSKKSRIANDFHSKQAIKITQDNRDEKDKDVEKELREREKQQKEMSQGGKGKNKSPLKHVGKFAFY